jgi:hypothetical protein
MIDHSLLHPTLTDEAIVPMWPLPNQAFEQEVHQAY